MESLIDRIEKLKPKKIVVIGDLILDKYVIGTSERLSPEAPVPIVDPTEIKHNLGGAANTAMNVKTLGGIPYLIGIIGEDDYGEIFKEVLLKNQMPFNGIRSSPFAKTLLKERFVVGNQQLLRVDYNKAIKFNKLHEDFILRQVDSYLKSADIFVISDYAKGTLSPYSIEKILSKCEKSGQMVIVDPRPKNKSSYATANFITPNWKEACEMVNINYEMNIDNAKLLAAQLYKELNPDSSRRTTSIVLTMANQGIYFYCNGFQQHFPTFPRQVRDVSGAGDAVVAGFAIGLSNNWPIEETLLFGNHIGGVKVEKSGVQPVYRNEVSQDVLAHPDKK